MTRIQPKLAMRAYACTIVLFMVAMSAALGWTILTRLRPNPVLLLVPSLMVVFTVFALRWLLTTFRGYEFDEQRLATIWFGRRSELAWTDVVDLSLQRNTTVAAITLRGPDGTKLSVDFAQLGASGEPLFLLLTRKLDALLEAKVDGVEREGRRFIPRWNDLFPLPGAVTVRDGAVARGTTLRVANIEEIRVREVRRLYPSQSFELRGDGKLVTFTSLLDDGAILLRYLRRHVPVERWTTVPAKGFNVTRVHAVLLAVLWLLPVGQTLGFHAADIGLSRRLVKSAEEVDASVITVDRVAWLATEIQYSYPVPARVNEPPSHTDSAYADPGRTNDAPSDSYGVSRAFGPGELPQVGDTLRVRRDPKRPSDSQPTLARYRWPIGYEISLVTSAALAALLHALMTFWVRPAREDFYLRWSLNS